MILTAHQPAYLPWLGYFEKIMQSDIFVFLDNVQFEKNSFTNRNKIKGSEGTIWLTVPVKTKGHMSSTILNTEIDNSCNWKGKQLKTIYCNYKKAPRFNECFAKLEKLYQEDYEFLADFCYSHLLFWLNEIGISQKIVRLSSMGINSKKSDLILEICKELGATQYISGAFGRDYIQEKDFSLIGVDVVYQNYQHPVYPQLWGEFIPSLSILDLWMNTNNFSLITGGK